MERSTSMEKKSVRCFVHSLLQGILLSGFTACAFGKADYFMLDKAIGKFLRRMW